MKTESNFIRLFPKPLLFQNSWNCSTRRLAIGAFLFLVANLFSTSAEKLQIENLYSFPTPPVHPQSRLVQGVDGSFYGTSAAGGRHGLGTIFRITTEGVWTKLADFDATNGASLGSLLQAKDHCFYGTAWGGPGGGGTVFKVTINGVLTTLASFTGTNGDSPSGLVQGVDGSFYGTTASGGDKFDGTNLNSGFGTIFKLTTNGTLTTLVSFNGTNGAYSQAALTQGVDGNFYGTTLLGGDKFSPSNQYSGHGTVFKVTPNGTLTTLLSFNGTNGARPTAELVQGADGSFYGTTYQGGPGFDEKAEWLSFGTVFKMTPNGTLTTLVFFNGTNGADPLTGLAKGADGSFYGTTSSGFSGATVFKVTPGGGLTTLKSFTDLPSTFAHTATEASANGLVRGTDGNFYGTTTYSGVADAGTVFKMTPSGAFTTLAEFNPMSTPAQLNPYSGLVQSADGDFYGTTAYGGTNGLGTVFKMTPSGVLIFLTSFGGTNGAYPSSGLIKASDGNLYGTTPRGGENLNDEGTLFKIATNGLLSTLPVFKGANGAWPNNLLQGADGNFYGTTARGGLHDAGTVFKATASGELTKLVSFNGTNGYSPDSLLQGTDGNLYGTTAGAWFNSGGTAFKVTPDGTLVTLALFAENRHGYPVESSSLVVGIDGNLYGTRFGVGPWQDDGAGPIPGIFFRLTPTGELTTFKSFDGINELLPSGLVKAADGTFYGTTYYGGENDAGTVFKITANGTLTKVFEFDGVNGAHPRVGLVRGADGFFYGTTSQGGSDGGGTIFRLIPQVQFTAAARQPGGTLLLKGVGPPNVNYRLWASGDVTAAFSSWVLVTNSAYDSNGNMIYSDPGAATSASRFYRITVP